ncbi:membrane protein [Rhizobium gallicum]|uniref:membrane protein n=1 Tax=Rhizobium gallicum TaxID=56730 RepID=UPI000374BFF5
MTSNDDILRALGRVEGRLTGIEESVSLIREDLGDEKDNARESRAVIHRRLDEQSQQIHLLDKVVEISSGVDATLREEIKSIKETVEKNHEAVAPTLEEWKKMKTLGYGISGLIAFAGLTIGGTIAYASDGAVAWVRHWLKIN